MRYSVSKITENKSLKKTMVIGSNVLLAILNQMNENAQKIIASNTETYVFTLLFNALLIKFNLNSGAANLNLKFHFFLQLK